MQQINKSGGARERHMFYQAHSINAITNFEKLAGAEIDIDDQHIW